MYFNLFLNNIECHDRLLFNHYFKVCVLHEYIYYSSKIPERKFIVVITRTRQSSKNEMKKLRIFYWFLFVALNQGKKFNLFSKWFGELFGFKLKMINNGGFVRRPR
jgi:hypothetical protein